MAHLFDPQGHKIELGAELGSGGEGAVFALNDARYAAKIYHRAVTREKADKLRWMARLATPELIRFASWPLAVLHNGRPEQVAGIVLPRIKDHAEVHKLYSPAQRKLEYADKDWSFLVHAAMNCAAAFDAIHAQSHVIGDVNQGNVLVSKQGTVFLIDCDSFQVNARKSLFLCEVGVPQFTPPELQGHNFRGLRRTTNHDRFGLALLVFHLLCMGRHPFAGRFFGAGDMPIERAIAEYRFAFSRDAERLQMARPPQTLPVERLAPALAELFERAFCRGSEQADARPSAEEWHAALAHLAEELQVCSADRGHKFAAGLERCPWCELMMAGAPNFFLSVTFRGTTPEVLSAPRELETLWRASESVPRPTSIPLPGVPAAAAHIAPATPPPAVESAQSLATMVKYVAAGSLVAMLAMIADLRAGYVTVPLLTVFSIWWLVLLLTSGHRPERNRRRRVLRARATEFARLQKDWRAIAARADVQFRLVKKELRQAYDQLGQLRAQFEADLRRLSRDYAKRQIDEFLQNKFIADQKIEGIGPGRQATLASYGIETAYDVDYNRVLGIPGFGPDATNKIVAWRSGLERQFTVNKSRGVPPAQRQSLLLQYAQVKQQLELKLRHGSERLRAVEIDVRRALAQRTNRVEAAYLAALQAKADLEAMRGK